MRAKDVKRFLEALWGEKEDRGWMLLWDGIYRDGSLREKQSGWAKAVEEAVARIEARSHTPREMYVGCGLREKPHGDYKRGGAADICAIPGVWVEIDVEGPTHKGRGYPPTDADARTLLSATGLEPTIVIHSGHGFQAWWLFKEIWYFDSDEERQTAAQLCADWQATIANHAKAKGWTIDGTGDLARVLRIAGTVNHKDPELPVQVQLLTAKGPRYASHEDLEQRIDTRAQNVELASGSIDMDGLRFDDEVNPPMELVTALCEAQRKFRLAYENKRNDLEDPSSSAFCFSMAYWCVAAGWPMQSIIDLLIAWRRTHGHERKKPEWYTRYCIEPARRSYEKNESVGAAIASIESADEETPDHEVRDAVSKLCGVEIATLVQHGMEDAQYSFLLKNGETVALGSSEDMLRLRKVRARVYDKCGKLLHASLTEKRWFRCIELLTTIIQLQNKDVGDRKDEMRDLLSEYCMHEQTATDESDEGWKPAVAHGRPFIRFDEGRLYIYAGGLYDYLVRIKLSRITKQRMYDDLRYFGFGPRTVRGNPSRKYWFCDLKNGLDHVAQMVRGPGRAATREWSPSESEDE